MKSDCKEAFIREQQDPTSKTMQAILAQVEAPKEKGPKYYKLPDGLVVMRSTPTAPGRIVVPESLRAYVLLMHHNMPLAGHQGYKRMLVQIRDLFFCPGLKRDVTRWVQAFSMQA